MKAKIFIGLVLLTFGLTFLVGGEVLAAKKSFTVSAKALLRVDGAHPPKPTVALSPVMYEGAKLSDCTDINPELWVIQHDQWGTTWYDYQKNGSMGRMIAVGPGGHKHMIFHETEGPYPANPRWVTYNCKDPLDNWLGPTRIDGGTGINAGYAQMLVRHNGAEVALYHRTAGTPIWNSTLAIEDEDSICSGSFPNLYDLPDRIDAAMTDDNEGMWPKGCMVHVPYEDPVPDSNYVHYVVTESGPPGYTGAQTIGYARCVFQSDSLICHSPGYGPYIRAPNTGYPSSLDEIAVIDTIHTISAIAVTSPVSQKVAIVYSRPREDAQINNDVYYIESTNNGDDWIDQSNWPPIRNNVTNYPAGNGDRAFYDVAACYDYNDTLHILWNAHYYDSIAGTVTYSANLYHWRQGHSITMIAPGPSDGVYPGIWNRTISKPSVAALDPIYHPGGDPDSVFLYCTWTQFNENDLSQGGYTNGDIYANISIDAGSTWTRPYNLTNTNTDGCAAGECLSEHWSSLAENMYDGTMHIEYVCDRDAGGIVQDEGTWTENDMMYMHVLPYPPPTCGVAVRTLEPRSWRNPPVKVLPGGYRVIAMELIGIYWGGGDYEVTTDNPNVVPTLNGTGYLSPGEEKRVELTINCPGEESFLNVTIYVHYCIGTTQEDTTEVKLYAVQSSDYYECDRDSLTQIQKDNGKLKLWACANCEERLWDKRIAEEERQEIIFTGGTIVATSEGGGYVKVVGRQDYKDTFTGARDTINVVEGYDYYQPECNIQKIHVKDTYIWTPHLNPPYDFKWWWIDIHKQIILFHDNPEVGECPNWRKEQVIKYVWIDWSPPPVWWPDPGTYPGHENIYFGVFADVDAPFDQGCNGCNTAGYDSTRQMAWFHGWHNDALPDGHPEYEDHHVGLALTDQDGNVVAPLGAQIVLAEDYLYPQNGWGWKDEELYELAATAGVNIHHPDSVADHAMVMTADMIPGGNDTLFQSEFILIEASIPTGLEDLQAHIDTTRELLIPELSWLGLFQKELPICGDVNSDGKIDVGDIIYLLNYLFGPGCSPPEWPINRADVNNDGIVDVGDIVFLINHLFLGASPPVCSGFGRG